MRSCSQPSTSTRPASTSGSSSPAPMSESPTPPPSPRRSRARPCRDRGSPHPCPCARCVGRSSRSRRHHARAGRRRRRAASRAALASRAPRLPRRTRRGRGGRLSGSSTAAPRRKAKEPVRRRERWRMRPVPPRVRLADLLAGLSIAIDLGFGLPPETAMRSCLVATRLARAHGLAEADVRDSFFTSLLLHVGCPGFSHETAALFGNELAVTRAAARTNLADPADYERTLIPEATRGLSPGVRRRVTERLIREGPAFGERYDTASCEIASSVARRIGIGSGVERALYEVAEWWNGGGAPQRLREDDITIGARVAHVAADAVVLDDLVGADLAVDGVRRRAGSVLDPSLVETFAASAHDILDRAGDPRTCLLEAEPPPVDERGLDELPTIAAVFGDVADLKFPACPARPFVGGGDARRRRRALLAPRQPNVQRARGRRSSPRPRAAGRDERDLGEAGAPDLDRVGTGANASVPLGANPRDIEHARNARAARGDAPRAARRLGIPPWLRRAGSARRRSRPRRGGRLPGDDAGPAASRPALGGACRRGARSRGAQRDPRRRVRRRRARGGRSGATAPARPAPRRPHRAGDRGSPTRRRRSLEPGDRARARHLTPNRRTPRSAHLRQAGRAESARARALRDGARPLPAERRRIGRPADAREAGLAHAPRHGRSHFPRHYGNCGRPHRGDVVAAPGAKAGPPGERLRGLDSGADARSRGLRDLARVRGGDRRPTADPRRPSGRRGRRAQIG